MNFSDLNLNGPLLNAIEDLGLTHPTAIQAKSFSPIMSGKDVIGIAQTGTGKTYAFLLPLLRMWKFTRSPHAQYMILVPTRELVTQIITEIEKLTTYMNVVSVGVYGGTNINTQKIEIANGLDIIVGTPGRMLDMLKDGVLKAKTIKKVVIDEVDEMLNLGFRIQLKEIFEHLPPKRQNLMFSATMIEEVEGVIEGITDYYDKIEAAPSGAPLENINQSYYEAINFNTKANLLELLLNENPDMTKVLVFIGTKKMSQALYERMEANFGEEAGLIHSSKSQNNRFESVRKFQEGEIRFLICTDIIARGIDVSLVSHVINFDLPSHSEKYIHRIGRTGRAKEKGNAISFIVPEEESYRIGIVGLMKKELTKIPIPEHLEIDENLIDLEKTVEYIPFNSHKMRTKKATGGTYHEKKEKNKKTVLKKSDIRDIRNKKSEKRKHKQKKKRKKR